MLSYLRKLLIKWLLPEMVEEKDSWLIGNPAPGPAVLTGKAAEEFIAQLRNGKPLDEKKLRDIREAKEFFDSIRV
ncbi:hypothetical protein [Chitinophaga sp. sic0106]|uniref:hypothetical protein n=1 Tax=Chitinophaga sp. sic0106 TaxID=2854785 RepID=UPI001C45BC1C|nr:hypothetical protein [Chitinophaga sp. sic0106]MBV7532196.1 hypothetical protein [Chitinophaga sp. sic0106]